MSLEDINPSMFLRGYQDVILEVPSYRDQRQRGFIKNEEAEDLKDTYTMRYEPDKMMLYVTVPQFNELPVDWRLHLKQNTQYLGMKSVNLLKGTGCVRSDGVRVHYVHVFDMGRVDSIKATSRPTKAQERNEYNRLCRMHNHNIHEVANGMELYRQRVAGMRPTKTKDDTQAEVIARLERQIKSLNQRLRNSKKAKVEKVKPAKTRIEALDGFFVEFKANTRTNITKRSTDHMGQPILIPPPKPMLTMAPDYAVQLAQWEEINQRINKDPAQNDPRNATIMLYEQKARLDNNTVTRKIYVQTSNLKHHVPNYRHDIRYTHSQSMKIHSDKDTPSVYCAVFDLDKT